MLINVYVSPSFAKYVIGFYSKNQHSILCESRKEMKHSTFSMIPKSVDKFAVETADITTTNGSSKVEITNEDNAHLFRLYQGYCSL
jgi:hypothetical protein